MTGTQTQRLGHQVDPLFFSEIRGFAVDMVRGTDPTTVLGAISACPEGITVDGIAEQLHIAPELVVDTIEVLEAEDLCERIHDASVTKVLPFAAFSSKNAHRYTGVRPTQR